MASRCHSCHAGQWRQSLAVVQGLILAQARHLALHQSYVSALQQLNSLVFENLWKSTCFFFFFSPPLKTQVAIDHPDWVTQYVMPRNPAVILRWAYMWCMFKGSKACMEETPSLLCRCTQKKREHDVWSICLAPGGISVMWAGGALGLFQGLWGVQKAVLHNNTASCVFWAPRAPRAAELSCPGGKRFMPSLLSTVLLPLGYKAPAHGLAKNTVLSVQFPEGHATSLNKIRESQNPILNHRIIDQ